jgi:hypothetical protein
MKIKLQLTRTPTSEPEFYYTNLVRDHGMGTTWSVATFSN